MQKFEIIELPGRLAVARLAPFSEIPLWAATGSISAIVRTAEELSIVCDAQSVPASVQSERDWVAFKIAGPLPFSQTGVLAGLIEPLAGATIPVFVVSTYDTDYILVKAVELAAAREIWGEQGHTLHPSPAFNPANKSRMP